MSQVFHSSDRITTPDSHQKLINHKFNFKEKDLDVLEATIGNIGKWQLKIYVLMIVVFAPSSWVELGIELFGHQTEFRCKPLGNQTKFRYKSLDESRNESEYLCSRPCSSGYEYNLSMVGTTIISEWDIVCGKQYILSIIQSTIMFGSLLGGVVFGIAADKHGRRITMFVCCILRFIFGVLTSFATDVVNFTISRFLLALFDGGIPCIALMMTVEVLGGKWRTLLGILFQIGFGVGFPLMAIVTYAVKNWRYAQFVLSAISFSSVFCAWIVPESPRWLLAVGKKDCAVNILEKAAKENGRNPLSVKKIVWEANDKGLDDDDDCSWWYLFRTPQLRRRTFLACINGALIFLVTNGYYQYFGEFSNNPFFDLSLQGVSVIIGAIVAAAIVTRYSRGRTIALMSFTVTLCSCLVLFFPNSITIRSILSAIILCSIGVTVAIVEPLIGELFPTVLRNSGVGIYSIFTGFATMISPVVVSLGQFYSYLPLVTFSMLSLLEMVFVLLLPDISNDKLPGTVSDIEN